MSEHEALIEWRSDGHFADGGYSRGHDWTFDGGAVVRGSSSPSVVPPPRSDPAAVDPEEALIASASSCHLLWFLSLAQAAGLDVASYRDRASGNAGPRRSRQDRDHPDHSSPRDRLCRPPPRRGGASPPAP